MPVANLFVPASNERYAGIMERAKVEEGAMPDFYRGGVWIPLGWWNDRKEPNLAVRRMTKADVDALAGIEAPEVKEIPPPEGLQPDAKKLEPCATHPDIDNQSTGIALSEPACVTHSDVAAGMESTGTAGPDFSRGPAPDFSRSGE